MFQIARFLLKRGLRFRDLGFCGHDLIKTATCGICTSGCADLPPGEGLAQGAESRAPGADGSRGWG